MKIFYFIVVLFIISIPISIRLYVKNKSLLGLVATLALFMLAKYSYVKPLTVWNSVFDPRKPTSEICNSANLTGYQALINITEECFNPCLKSIGVAYLVKIYYDEHGLDKTIQYVLENREKFITSDNAYPVITQWVPKRNTFVEYNFGELDWWALDSQVVSPNEVQTFKELCENKNTKDMCDFFNVDNMLFNAGQQDIYVTDVKWYDVTTLEITIERNVVFKLDDYNVVAFGYVLEALSVPDYYKKIENLGSISPFDIEGSSSNNTEKKTPLSFSYGGVTTSPKVSTDNVVKVCVPKNNDSFDIGATSCDPKSYTETSKFDYKQLVFNMEFCGDECYMCLGQMFICQEIIKKEGLCKAIHIINDNIDKFASLEKDYYPFIDVYNKIEETITARVSSNVTNIGKSVVEVENAMIFEILENQKEYMKKMDGDMDIDKQLEKTSDQLTQILQKHNLRLFLDAFNGKQITEYMSINSTTHEPILKRSLIKLYTISDEPYNIYMLGVGYTLSILKPLSHPYI